LSEGPSPDRIHGSRFKIHEYGSGNVPSTSGFIKVNIDPLELKIRIAMIWASGIDSVLIWDDLPKFGADLVATLSSLNVYNLSHTLKMIIYINKIQINTKKCKIYISFNSEIKLIQKSLRIYFQGWIFTFQQESNFLFFREEIDRDFCPFIILFRI
jgi:hypothetical protein